ncbi:MAG: chemotaxis protein CheB [bacterium]
MTELLNIGIITASESARNNFSQAVDAAGSGLIKWVLTAPQLSLCERQDKPDLVVVGACNEGDKPVETTRMIMQNCPTPILLLCDSVAKHSSVIFEAMGLGAIDVVSVENINSKLNHDDVVEIAAKISVVGKLIRAATGNTEGSLLPNVSPNFPLVAIGASTGGPAVLTDLLKTLPANFPAAIVIVQHIDEKFAENLVQWLDNQVAMSVHLSHPGTLVKPGNVYVASGKGHLTLTANGTMESRDEPGDCVYQPCIDVFFQSVARHWTSPAIGILLSGMGSDGAQGLLEMRGAGITTITQDEGSSAVFGMPQMAIKLGAAEKVLDPAGISKALLQAMEL